MFVVWAYDDFNSIKVRLEPVNQILSIEATEFQFHKGTIRTGGGLVTLGICTLFQFHKGTIRTSESWRYLCKYDISIP